ncbi:MAG TPA: hypothetical protein PKA88_03460, partial [Polyangiaceae bacterium]|nr:hypothetical protein [Polyangiaceae bacterium]
PTGGWVSCAGGKCPPACPAGKTLCGTVCVDTQSDNLNCGACAYKCWGNHACSSGKCSTYSCAYASCDGECCDATEKCNSYWGTDINGKPVKHYYCG